MLQKKISFIDETYNEVFLENYNLYVFIYKNYSIHTMLDTRINKFVFFSSFPYDNLNTFKEKLFNKLINQNFKKIEIYLDTKYFFIPEHFFSENELITYYNYLSNKDKTNLLWAKFSKDIIIIFEDFLLYENFNKNNHFIILPNIITILRMSNKISSLYTKSNKFLIVNISQSEFDILAVKEKKLFLCNRFSYINENDIIYFIFYVLNFFSSDNKKTEIYLNGNIEKKNLVEKKLKNFNFPLYYTKLNNEFTYTYRLNEIKQHKIANLFYIKDENY